MERNHRWLSATLRVGPLLLFVWMVRSQLVAIALGALFALLLEPLARRVAVRWPKLAPHVALLLTIGAFVLVVIPLALVAARVVISAQDFLGSGAADVIGRIQHLMTVHFAGLAERFDLPVQSLRSSASDLAQRVGSAIAGLASGVASALPGQVVELFLFVLSLFYFLRDGERLVTWSKRLLPLPEPETDSLFASVRATVHGAIFGQLATSAIQGGLTLAALFAFQVPGALMFGILAMLLSVLPLVGTAPVTLGAAVYLLAAGRTGAAVGMAVAGVVIGLSDNVVRPWVQSAKTRMHPLLTLVSIFGGIEALGAAGVFLGPVVAAVAIWSVEAYSRRTSEALSA
ncbi:MAG: AI-2E family transporter [Sandaracinaceae bacterium]|nr:AI-2E family transporter [Sandaracinaceae bacterium]